MAIAGAFLIGLGFPPFQAAVLCLVANTAPVAWGGVGNPIRVLAGVTGLPEQSLNAMTGRILPPFSLILPLWLVRSMVDWKKTFEVSARAAGLRVVLCRDAILLVEFSRDWTRGHCVGHFLAVGHGGLSALLEAQKYFGTTPGERKG